MKNDAITLYRHDFVSYVGFAFRELNNGAKFLDNWHLAVIAEALRKVEVGERKKLAINLPPRTLKSHCMSVCWPIWLLRRDPRLKILCLSGHSELSKDLHNQRCKLLASRRHRALFPSLIFEDTGKALTTQQGGFIKHMSITANITGLGADIIIIDDPIGPYDAHDDTTRSDINKIFDQQILTRLNHKKFGAVVIAMQRVHEDDLTGHVLAQHRGWDHLSIPAIGLCDEQWDLGRYGTYERYKGDALQPERESMADLLGIAKNIGGYAFSYQYLQGQYKPRFGAEGRGGQWITPMRHGEFYDSSDPIIAARLPMGFYMITELAVMQSAVFGYGDPIVPDNMRTSLTIEELLIEAEKVQRYQAELLRDFES